MEIFYIFSLESKREIELKYSLMRIKLYKIIFFVSPFQENTEGSTSVLIIDSGLNKMPVLNPGIPGIRKGHFLYCSATTYHLKRIF